MNSTRRAFLQATGTALALLVPSALSAEINDVQSLVLAVNEGSPGDTIEIPAGRFELTAPLVPKHGMTIRGAGIGKTVIAAAANWKPGTGELPKKEDAQAFLFSFENAANVSLSHMTLLAPALQGAVYCNNCDDLEIHDVRFQGALWSSVMTYRMDRFRVHDCVFVDAGGKVKHSGGALYMWWTKDSEFWNNRITKTPEHPGGFFGFKGRQARRCRFHHNTVDANFSLELPFENDEDVEIDHNVFAGTISIPKHQGGMLIEEGHSFHIHHNLLRKSYAIEFSRNGVEIDHNLFDFTTEDDGGNLVSEFSKVLSPGPARIHNNLIRNPGRGLFWTNGGYNRLQFTNNHVIANTSTRQDGLFGFNAKHTDFSTIVIRDNIIECSSDNPRPLMRNEASYGAVVENNTLVNIADEERFTNRKASRKVGLTEPLEFRCGVRGETVVQGWRVKQTEPKE